MINTTEQYEGRSAYRCKRCHEWGFVTETDIRAAAILHTDPLDCPYCDTKSGLEAVGRVKAELVISEHDRTACNDSCTSARGTICVCACRAVNHGKGLTIRITVVEGKLVVILADIERAKRRAPKVLIEIAEFDKAFAEATVALANVAKGYVRNYRLYAMLHKAKKDMIRVNAMHSHKGRMKTLAAVVAAVEAYNDAVEDAQAQQLGVIKAAQTIEAMPTIVSNPVVAPVLPTVVSIQAMATDRQVSYIEMLVRTRGSAADAAVDVRDLTMSDASAFIGRLLALPVNQVGGARVFSAPALPQVREGRYAITENGHVAFYKVDRPTEGKWAGRTFVAKVIGGREDFSSRVKVYDSAERARILAAIAVDQEAALKRYGREIGQCGHCNRVLTDAESIAAGIGPVCAKAWA